MTQKTINCADCNVEFTFEENPKFPRKYCMNCGNEKKLQWAGAMSKTEAKVTAGAEEGWRDAPVERTVTSSTTIGEPMEDPLEYQIRSREVRCRALEASLELDKRLENNSTKNILDIAEEFVEWIYDAK